MRESDNDAGGAMMSDFFSLAPKALETAGPLALVTLLKVEGSTYRKPGARLLVSRNGSYGLLSGGCLESEVARLCKPVLEGRADSIDLYLDTRRFLGCDGRLTLLAERVRPKLFAQISKMREERTERHCLTSLTSTSWKPTRLSRQKTSEQGFWERILPPRRLLVFGSGPDVPPLRQMAEAIGWEWRHLVFPSDPQATHAETAQGWAPEMGVSRLKLDGQTAVVVMNHHFGRDLEALHALWDSPTAFLGLLGSRTRRDQLLVELMRRGVELERRHLHAPVGLDLAAEGPREIALEICAQVQFVFAQADRQLDRPALKVLTGHRPPDAMPAAEALN